MTGVESNLLGRPIGHEINNLTDSQIGHTNPILVLILRTRNPGKFLEFVRLNMK